MQSYKKILQKLHWESDVYTKIILVCCLFLSGIHTRAQDKKLQLEGNSFTLGELFGRIEQQTNYNIGYSSTLLDKSLKVTLNDPKETVAQILIQALKGSGYTYRINGAYIFIEKGEEEIVTRSLKGTVFDDRTGLVIAGASIQVSGHPSLKAQSNGSGEFIIKGVPVGDHSIRVAADWYMPIDLGISLSKTADASIRVRLNDTRQEEPITYADSSDIAAENSSSQQDAVEIIVQSIDNTVGSNSNNSSSNNDNNSVNSTYTTDSTIINDTTTNEQKESVIVGTNILSKKSVEKENKPYRPSLAEKVNLLYLATTSLNIGAELALSDKWTIDVALGYNPWKFGDGKIKHWLVMPEIRYWLCQSFEGHFLGIHGLYSQFNVGNLSFISSMKNYTYEGSMYGGGISYGYHFPLKGRWGLELTAGLGYLRLDYDKYECHGCKEKKGAYKRDYWGPTKAGVTLIYMLD